MTPVSLLSSLKNGLLLLLCSCVLTAVAALDVSSLSLVDSESDETILILSDGASFDLRGASTSLFTITAEPSADVESLRFQLSGPVVHNQIESKPPYALFGDAGYGRLNGQALPVGVYNLTVTPYSEDGNKGDVGPSTNLSFTITDGPALNISSLTLVDTDSNATLLTLSDGASLDLQTAGASRFSILAETSAEVESVRFQLSGPVGHKQTESALPYTLFGDGGFESYNGQGLLAGAYTLTVTPYSENSASGVAGPSTTVSFTLTSAASQLPANTLPTPAGRIAISHAGNLNDPNEGGALAMSAALLWATGMGDRVVHIDYNNYLGVNDADMADEMMECAAGIATRFGIDPAIMFNAQKRPNTAIANFAAKANASTAADPLWLLCAGPMEMPYRMLAAVDASKLQYIHCVSHNTANEDYLHAPEMTHTWAQMKTDFPAVAFHDIAEQGQTGDAHDWYTHISLWYWLNTPGFEPYSWVHAKSVFTTAVDSYINVADAGMTYWLLSGGPNGGDDDAAGWYVARPLLEGALNLPPENTAPQVYALADGSKMASITLPDDTVELQGTVTDDGLPNGTLSHEWVPLVGPGTAVIADPTALNTNVQFTEAGTYYFNLTATDGDKGGYNTVGVTVNPAPPPENTAPQVDARVNGSKVIAYLTLPDDTVELQGTVTDDGLPNGTLSYTWEAANPGTAIIYDATALTTSVQFIEEGTYYFNLRATDGELVSYDTVGVIVEQAPPSPPPPEAKTHVDGGINLQPVISFGNHDGNGDVSVHDSGYSSSIILKGDCVKRIDLSSLTIDADTLLAFSFSSTVQGSIQGIGLHTDNTLVAPQVFNVYGSDTGWGIQDERHSGYGTTEFLIPIGAYLSGMENPFLTLHNLAPQGSGIEAACIISQIRIGPPETMVTVIKAINCGGGNYTALDGTVYQGDYFYSSGGYSRAWTFDADNTLDDPIYHIGRFGSFTYDIPVTSGQEYLVELHFAEPFISQPGSRKVRLYVENGYMYPVDVYAEVGLREAYIWKGTVPVNDGYLTIEADEYVGEAMLQAIRIIGPALPQASN